MSPEIALAGLWAQAGGTPAALDPLRFVGDAQPVWASSFAVDTAAQASLAAAALGAAGVGRLRQPRGQPVAVEVDRRAAALGCSSAFRVDGVAPPMWDPLSGLYPCGGAIGQPGHLRLHTNFAHHRDAAQRALGCAVGPDTPRDAVATALRHWAPVDAETAVYTAGGVAAAVRDFAAWDALPQAAAVAAEPLIAFERVGDAPPLPWPGRAAAAGPLAGLRVLDLTRILAGPVSTRLLAGWGAEVLMLSGPHLPHIAAVADTSQGKRSAWLDLRDPAGAAQLRRLVAGAHVWVQAYRPGSLAGRGFGPAELASVRPGLVMVSLAAWGHGGPWAGRRGFDSLVQTAVGLNRAEADAAGRPAPTALPVQILDHAAGHLMALGATVALARQAEQGGSWLVRVSLAGVARWLRGLGQDAAGLQVASPDPAHALRERPSGFGRLETLPPAVRFDGRDTWPAQPSVRPGTHAPVWSAVSSTA